MSQHYLPLLVLLLLCTCVRAPIHAQQVLEIKEVEDQGRGLVVIKDNTFDRAGNRLIVGQVLTNNNVDFDPGPDTEVLDTPTDRQQTAGYLASYTPNGTLNFVFPLIETEILAPNSDIREVATDANNNIYVHGTFVGKVDLDPSAAVAEVRAPTSANRFSFIASYDQNGNYRWGFSFPFSFSINLGGEDAGEDHNFHVDEAGNSYLLATTLNRGDADPGPGEFLLDSQEKYLLSYDAQGTFRFGWDATVYAEDLGVNANGDFVISGTLDRFFPNDYDFSPGADTASIAEITNQVAFLAAYTSEGDLRQLRQLTGEGGGLAPEIVEVAPDGSYYLAGFILGPTDLDPGGGETILTPDEFELDLLGDLFVAEYAPNGDFRRHAYFRDLNGQTSQGSLRDLAISPDGHLIIALQQQFGAVNYGTESAPLIVGGNLVLFTEVIVVLDGEDLTGQAAFTTVRNLNGIVGYSVAAHPTCEQYGISLFFRTEEDINIDLPQPNDDLFFPSTNPDLITAALITLDIDSEGVGDCALVSSAPHLEQTVQPLHCFPNPTAGELYLKLPETAYGPAQVTVYNALGVAVQRTNWLDLAQPLDLRTLPPGNYWLSVRAAGRSYWRSIVKS